MGFAGCFVRNYEELALAKETFWGSEIITDHNLYCYNDQAVRAFAGQGVTKNTVPLELNRSEIKRRYNEEKYDDALRILSAYDKCTVRTCQYQGL